MIVCLCTVSATCSLVDLLFCFFFQAEDGIRDLVRSRGLGDVYKRQGFDEPGLNGTGALKKPYPTWKLSGKPCPQQIVDPVSYTHLTLPTSDLV